MTAMPLDAFRRRFASRSLKAGTCREIVHG